MRFSKRAALSVVAAVILGAVTAALRGQEAAGTGDERVTIHIIGDSTVASYPANRAPLTGWGQVLHQYFDDSVTVANHAVGGRSSKSFVDEGRWDKVRQSWKSGDWLFIQFGHNDQKSQDPTRYTDPRGSYRQYLTDYVTQSRAAGVHPVVVTSMYRRRFQDGKPVDTLGDYPQAARETAEKLDAPLVDLHAKSRDLLARLGEDRSKQIFLWLDPGEQANYPEGKADNSHFSTHGAEVLAGLVVAEIKRLNLPLADRIDATVPLPGRASEQQPGKETAKP